MNQTSEIMNIMAFLLGINIFVGDKGKYAPLNTQVLITTANYFQKKSIGREVKEDMTKNLDLSNVRVVVFDEADEIFYTEGNEAGIKAFMGNFQTLGIKPQCLFYSATLNEDIKYKIANSVHVDQYFEVPREALIIKGIKQFKMFF